MAANSRIGVVVLLLVLDLQGILSKGFDIKTIWHLRACQKYDANENHIEHRHRLIFDGSNSAIDK